MKIWKINKIDYLNSVAVTADSILFSYAEQVNFSNQPNNTEWDAEALISINEEHLMLFTKDWVNGHTYTYMVPKFPGDYIVQRQHSYLAAEGLITGASFLPTKQSIVLSGYDNRLQPFIYLLDNFDSSDILGGKSTKIALPSLGLEQIEGITHAGEDRILMVSEAFSFLPVSEKGKLIAMYLNNPPTARNNNWTPTSNLYPNPTTEYFYIEDQLFESLELFDHSGRLVLKSANRQVVTNTIPSGMYIIKIRLNNGDHYTKHLIIQ